MTIVAPTPPTFGIQIVLDDGKPIGTLDEQYEAAEAKRMLARVQDSFPKSTLAMDEGFPTACWVALSDEQAKSVVYRHTVSTLLTLMNGGLPVAHWTLAPYAADKLNGTIHIRDLDKARAAIEAYAEVFDVKEIQERTTEHAICLELGEVVWGGVRIELSTYTARLKDAAVEQAPVGA